MGNLCGKPKCGSSTSKRSARDGSMFRYDPSSYSLNFDDGRRETNVNFTMAHGSSTRVQHPQSRNLPER